MFKKGDLHVFASIISVNTFVRWQLAIILMLVQQHGLALYDCYYVGEGVCGRQY